MSRYLPAVVLTLAIAVPLTVYLTLLWLAGGLHW